MRLPNDKVDITWGQLRQVLDSYPEKLRVIEEIELRNSCYQKAEDPDGRGSDVPLWKR